MSELEGHFDLGTGWPLQKDVPSDKRGVGRSPWFGLGLLTALASLMIAIAIAIGLRVFMGSPRPQRIDIATVKSMPKEELRKIAIEEVKRREGWAGKAVGPFFGEGSDCRVHVERDPENPKEGEVEVELHSVGGTILGYRKVQREAAEAAQAWKALLRAMALRNEKRIRQFTTRAGFESLERRVDGEEGMDVLEQVGKRWLEWETRWQHSDAPDRVECRLGTEPKEHLLVFKKTAEGWKLDEWQPGS